MPTPSAPAAPPRRWVRPALAFAITFGVLAMAASVVRVVAAYQRFDALGYQRDGEKEIPRLNEELARMDQHYTPIFLLVATTTSALAALGFARWRPGTKARGAADETAETR